MSLVLKPRTVQVYFNHCPVIGRALSPPCKSRAFSEAEAGRKPSVETFPGMGMRTNQPVLSPSCIISLNPQDMPATGTFVIISFLQVSPSCRSEVIPKLTQLICGRRDLNHMVVFHGMLFLLQGGGTLSWSGLGSGRRRQILSTTHFKQAGFKMLES